MCHRMQPNGGNYLNNNVKYGGVIRVFSYLAVNRMKALAQLYQVFSGHFCPHTSNTTHDIDDPHIVHLVYTLEQTHQAEVGLKPTCQEQIVLPLGILSDSLFKRIINGMSISEEQWEV